MSKSMTPWQQREHMHDAYCSYIDCDNDIVYPLVMTGTQCPGCGKPLSWVGDKCIRMPLGKITKGKDQK